MKSLKLLLLSLFIATGSFAQFFEVPEDYKFVVAEDYARYEKQIVSCIDWLASTPVNEQEQTRRKANAFLMKWVDGSPNVMIELNEDLLPFADNPELLMTYIGGYTRYSIESGNYKDKLSAAVAGMEAVIIFYKKNKSAFSTVKGVEKYMKMQEKGTMKEYIQKNLHS